MELPTGLHQLEKYTADLNILGFLHGLYINGSYCQGGGEAIQTLYPATNALLTSINSASKQDTEAAIAAAAAAFAEWKQTPAAVRGRILRNAAEILRSKNEALAHLETLDTGKPIAESLVVDVASAADCLEFFGGIAASIHGEYIDLGTAFGYTRREPLGVCAAIGAWNYPLQIAAWKAAPALACGNTMVYKPSELTPLTALQLASVLSEAGLPDGVFNVICGFGGVGQLLASHQNIAKVSLTGSVATGIQVMQAAAATLKPVTLELGGKSPIIVFADADIENAVKACLNANFYTQGEICSNGTRVFVENSIATAFIATLAERAQQLRIGDPLDPHTQIGAQISAAHCQKVIDAIEQGKREGAKLVCGGSRVGETFVSPTIFIAQDHHAIAQQEIFGPVMSILAFASEAEVISRANATEFGLAAGVFTQDIKRGHRVVAALDAGTCWINNYNITPIELPFGGVKLSGIGRENSLAAIEHYTTRKSVYVEMGDVASDY